jgi:DNA-binding CsgD family transcriptional regulator
VICVRRRFPTLICGQRPGFHWRCAHVRVGRYRLNAIAAVRVADRRSARGRPSALTAAELRLLPLLSTQLPVSEIAAELFLSPHTVKSEMKSICRKLGATSRTQAVTRSRELGLLGL